VPLSLQWSDEELRTFQEQGFLLFRQAVEPERCDAIREVAQVHLKYHIPPLRIILLPEGRDQEVLRNRQQWVSEACVKHGFRFSTRLHILLWGDQRGR